MKVLLDENMPHKLRQNLPGHEVVTVAFLNWGGIRNGQLLANAASAGFDVLLTMDAGIEYEQNLSALPCSVIVVRAESNAFEHIAPHLPAILAALVTLAPRSLVKVG
jgi:predicted nuclease of predicted toxin-antitoxin system